MSGNIMRPTESGDMEFWAAASF